MLLEDRRRTGRASASRRSRSAGRRAPGGASISGVWWTVGVGRVGHEAASAELRPRPARRRGARAAPRRGRRASRSVSKVRIVAASSNGIQRTSSNSWSCSAQVAADRLHQEVVDGLVDARAGLDEPVLDRVQRAGDPDLEPGLLGDLAQGRLLGRLAGVRACPWAASRSGRRARAGGCRRRARAALPRSGRRCRRRTWRSRSSGVPRRRCGARASGRARRARTVAQSHDHARPRSGRSTAPSTAAGWIARQPARSRVSGRDLGAVAARSRGRRGAWNDPAGRRPSRRSRTRVDGRTKSGRRPGRVLGGDAVIHGRLWYRFRPALQGRVEHRCASSPRPPVPARHGPRPRSISRRAAATYSVEHAGGVGAQRVEVRRAASRRRRGSSARSARPGCRAPGRCRASPR